MILLPLGLLSIILFLLAPMVKAQGEQYTDFAFLMWFASGVCMVAGLASLLMKKGRR